jgi:mRNA (guanine-N7-)-methyltransferase
MNSDYTKRHYDSTLFHSQRDRAQGVLYKLKKYHNAVKRELITTYAQNADSLLDVCCGRGGDLQKWKAARVKYVRGLDLSPVEIKEAQRRYATLHSPYLTCEFQIADLAQPYMCDRVYDVVTCMFGLHYFFESERVLDTFLDTVTRSLKPGGVFFGIAPNETRMAHAKSSDYLSVTPLNIHHDDVYTRRYAFSLCDTVTDSVESAGSIEFLVHFDTLVSKLSDRGVVLISRTPLVPNETYPGYEASLLFESFVFAYTACLSNTREAS